MTVTIRFVGWPIKVVSSGKKNVAAAASGVMNWVDNHPTGGAAILTLILIILGVIAFLEGFK